MCRARGPQQSMIGPAAGAREPRFQARKAASLPNLAIGILHLPAVLRDRKSGRRACRPKYRPCQDYVMPLRKPLAASPPLTLARRATAVRPAIAEDLAAFRERFSLSTFGSTCQRGPSIRP